MGASILSSIIKDPKKSYLAEALLYALLVESVPILEMVMDGDWRKAITELLGHLPPLIADKWTQIEQNFEEEMESVRTHPV